MAQVNPVTDAVISHTFRGVNRYFGNFKASQQEREEIMNGLSEDIKNLRERAMGEGVDHGKKVGHSKKADNADNDVAVRGKHKARSKAATTKTDSYQSTSNDAFLQMVEDELANIANRLEKGPGNGKAVGYNGQGQGNAYGHGLTIDDALVSLSAFREQIAARLVEMDPSTALAEEYMAMDGRIVNMMEGLQAGITAGADWQFYRQTSKAIDGIDKAITDYLAAGTVVPEDYRIPTRDVLLDYQDQIATRLEDVNPESRYYEKMTALADKIDEMIALLTPPAPRPPTPDDRVDEIQDIFQNFQGSTTTTNITNVDISNIEETLTVLTKTVVELTNIVSTLTGDTGTTGTTTTSTEPINAYTFNPQAVDTYVNQQFVSMLLDSSGSSLFDSSSMLSSLSNDDSSSFLTSSILFGDGDAFGTFSTSFLDQLYSTGTSFSDFWNS